MNDLSRRPVQELPISAPRDICIYSKTSDACRIPIISQHIDPMIYQLLFPHGECGWHPDLTCSDKNGKQHKLTTLQYYSYKISVREIFNPCLSARKLTQQFIVDAWTKIESCRLYYIRNEQDSLRTDMYKGLMDYVHNQTANSNTVIGKMVILPSSIRGSSRPIQQNFLESMTICQNFGKPDLFLTMTCNRNWKEITENLNENENAIDRSDIVTRVFHEKVNILKDELLKKNIFGEVIAFIYVIEFQKRGLPHIQ